MIPISVAIEECQKQMSASDIPCLVISTWHYPLACNNYNVDISNSSGMNIAILNMGDFGASGFCNFTFSNMTAGSYAYNISSGDSGSITVKEDNMIIGLVAGIGIVIFLFFFVASQLDKEHVLLKFLIFSMGISLLLLIPRALISVGTTNTLFYKSLVWIIRIFWGYVFIYFIYKVLTAKGFIKPMETMGEKRR
jgi:hypothetical protein